MQFTNEVNWSLFDFIIMGILLGITGLSIEVVFHKIKRPRYRVILSIAILVLFLLIWAELGVGIFGTPFAGS